AVHRGTAARAGDLPPAAAGSGRPRRARANPQRRDRGGGEVSGAVVLPQPDVVVKKDAPRAWKTPIVMAVFTLVALLWFVLGTGDAEVGFRWSAARSAIRLPDTVVSPKALALIATVLLAAITVVVALLVQRRARVSIWIPVGFGLIWLAALLRTI